MSESKDEARQPEGSGGHAEKRQGRDAGQKIQRQLDEALADSFPASDPVSIVTSNEEEDLGTDPADDERSPDAVEGGRSKRAP
jgi:hypothetical protein